MNLITRLLTCRYKIFRMQDKPLEIEKVEQGPGTTVLRLHGPLLLGNFFPLQTMVRADSSNLLIIDVSDMPYIDSAGIGCLVGAHVSRENSGRKLVLLGANDRLITSLKVTKVEQLFTMAPTLEQAVAHASH
jgi:anti-sigma B factor antagonist